jgi:hypothetical protein
VSFLKYQDFIEKNKSQLKKFVPISEDFTRNRKLGLVHTIGHVLYLASQRNLNGYEITSQSYFSQFGSSESVCRSSLSEARNKIHWRAFEFLLKKLNQEEHPDLKHLKWKGHNVKAIDGTWITLPATESILKKFPRRPNPQSKAHYPYALLVAATNIFTGQPVCARLGDHHSSERDFLLKLLNAFKTGDVLLLDRGYDGIFYWHKMTEKGLYFVARARAQGNLTPQFYRFLRSKKKTAIVTLERKIDGKIFSVTVRLIRGPKDRLGVPTLLVTNLLDDKKYSNADIFDLYLKRWRIETMYYQVKELFRLEKFHSKKVNGILQEIFSNLFILSLNSLAVQQAMISKKLPTKDHVPNYKAAAEVVKRNFCLFIKKSSQLPRKEALKTAQRIVEQIMRIYCIKQPGRKNPRISKQPCNTWARGNKDKPKLKREHQQKIVRLKKKKSRSY